MEEEINTNINRVTSHLLHMHICPHLIRPSQAKVVQIASRILAMTDQTTDDISPRLRSIRIIWFTVYWYILGHNELATVVAPTSWVLNCVANENWLPLFQEAHRSRLDIEQAGCLGWLLPTAFQVVAKGQNVQSMRDPCLLWRGWVIGSYWGQSRDSRSEIGC